MYCVGVYRVRFLNCGADFVQYTYSCVFSNMSASEDEPAFSENSAQDTALAAREAQEWIEVIRESPRPYNAANAVCLL